MYRRFSITTITWVSSRPKYSHNLPAVTANTLSGRKKRPRHRSWNISRRTTKSRKNWPKESVSPDYDRRVTYPVGVHIYFEGQIHEVIRSISGYRKPATKTFWEKCVDTCIDMKQVSGYTQFKTYYPGDKVNYNGVIYSCLAENGYKFDDIRIPMVAGWLEVETSLWHPVEYPLWSVVEYEDGFFTLVSLDNFDSNVDPMASSCWGAIADYDSAYNAYELSENEYVVYDRHVFYPETDINAD